MLLAGRFSSTKSLNVLQRSLWVGISARWHSKEQYFTLLQPTQVSLPVAGQAGQREPVMLAIMRAVSLAAICCTERTSYLLLEIADAK